MKYKLKDNFEAFKLGIDNMPNWFMDGVSARSITLHGNSTAFNHCNDTSADISTDNGEIHANYGDYIACIRSTMVVFEPKVFEGLFETAYCDGCVHKNNWENEVEYGYPSPCTACSRRCIDNYLKDESFEQLLMKER